MSKITEFPSNIIQELKYYVYIYSDPDTLQPFYIGKGKGIEKDGAGQDQNIPG